MLGTKLQITQSNTPCLQVLAAMRHELHTGGRVFVVCSNITDPKEENQQYRVRDCVQSIQRLPWKT